MEEVILRARAQFMADMFGQDAARFIATHKRDLQLGFEGICKKYGFDDPTDGVVLLLAELCAQYESQQDAAKDRLTNSEAVIALVLLAAYVVFFVFVLPLLR